MSKNIITIGADPEIFIKNITSQDVISSIGIIPGSKQNPYKLSNNTYIQPDNVMLEFNIIPATNAKDFQKNIVNAISQINTYLASINKSYRGHIIEIAHFNSDNLFHPEACKFGCDPDYNVYTDQMNEILSPDFFGNKRVAGGHIHIGYNFDNEKHKKNTIKVLDLLYFLFIKNEKLYPFSNIRLRTYGKPGNYRLKPYGIEYRTPSNSWLTNSQYIKYMFNITEEAIINQEVYLEIINQLELNPFRNYSDFLVKSSFKELFSEINKINSNLKLPFQTKKDITSIYETSSQF